MIGKIDIGGSFPGLMAYLTAAERWLKPDDILLFNIAGIKTAVHELQAAARRSRRVKKPVGHLILSWRSDEAPTPERMREAAERVLELLGIDEHKAVAVIHADTDNHHHLHIIFSRVGPAGTVPPTIDSWSFASVERAVASVARDMDFLLVPGRFNAIDSEEFGPAISPPRDPTLPASLSDGFRGYRAQTGATAISEQLCADKAFRPEIIAARMAADWKALIEAFSNRGFTLCINGKTKGRSARLDAGLVIVDQANPERRQALSALNQTSDEKWSGPGLIRGIGRLGPKKFPAMGPPPERMLSIAPPTRRDMDGETAAPKPEVNTEQQGAAQAGTSDPGATGNCPQFSAKRDAARRHNAEVAKARAAARDRITADYRQRFEDRIEMAKRRRRMVRMAFGRGSVIGRVINLLADRRTDRDVAELKSERRSALAAVDAKFKSQRVEIPRWAAFEAKAIADADNASVVVAEQATADTPMTSQSMAKESYTNGKEKISIETHENRNGNDNDDAIQCNLHPNRVGEFVTGDSSENPSSRAIRGRAQQDGGKRLDKGGEQLRRHSPVIESPASGQRSAGFDDDPADEGGVRTEIDPRAASSDSQPPATASLSAEDIAQRKLLTARLRQLVGHNANALSKILAEAGYRQTGASLTTPTALTVKSLAVAKLRAWANSNRVNLIAAADLLSVPTNHVAASPPAADLDLRRMIATARLRAYAARHAKGLTELFDRPHPDPVPDQHVGPIESPPPSVSMAASPFDPGMVEVVGIDSRESTTIKNDITVEPDSADPSQGLERVGQNGNRIHDDRSVHAGRRSQPDCVPSPTARPDVGKAEDPETHDPAPVEGSPAHQSDPRPTAVPDHEEVERARISACKTTLRANGRARGKERLARIANIIYHRWALQYVAVLDREFRLFPDSPYAAALGIIESSDRRYVRRRKEAFVIQAFKVRAEQKRQSDAFWAPLRDYQRAKGDITSPGVPTPPRPAQTSKVAVGPQSDPAESRASQAKHDSMAGPSGSANPQLRQSAPQGRAGGGATAPNASLQVSGSGSVETPRSGTATKFAAPNPASSSPVSRAARFTPHSLYGDERVLAAVIVALNESRKNPLFHAAVKASSKAMSDSLIEWMRQTTRDEWNAFVAFVIRNGGGRDRPGLLKSAARICTSKGIDVAGNGNGGNGLG